MQLDLQKFYQACNPSKTLAVENAKDRQYYIDFSSVRGGRIIEELKENITFFSPEEPTCELFTGHIGCGKSTELLRLKAELEQEGFHVVYFESSQDLEMSDVDIGDILLAIARRVSENLYALEIPEPKALKKILVGAARLSMTEIEVSQTSANQELSLVELGIGKITANAKNSPEIRSKLREYLEPRTKSILDAINEELLQPAIYKLKQYGKKGLVVIVDNLDRIDTAPRPWGRPQAEYLFVDRGEQLRQLRCHVVYTIPLELIFSNDLGRLVQRFMVDPKVLPMVSVQSRNGDEYAEGMALLRQMVLVRAFPEVDASERLSLMSMIFDRPETLDRLCRISGGHVRELLRLLSDWIKKERRLPLSGEVLETVIRAYRNQMSLAITEDEWDLLRQVQQQKWVSGDEGYRVLLRSRFVYEYRDAQGSWFDVNPILAESRRLCRSA
ncbi:KAP family P-loop domain-containing protein [Nostoc minutum NIES-26]|uniref:KAP family P-loop domain-containing protein n=1 Tax=Nostoc minutum NIES-26 TaxID=1844469 RepID=A0A367QWY7_9NOSO|nr:KAP family P-loop domain-containing protein [Nostoc minutum NIES-26]